MDPNAFYRGRLPLDIASMKALTVADKQVPIPLVLKEGTKLPGGTKLVCHMDAGGIKGPY
jgi:hypothetical protein